jgi:hypothetical protein
MYRSIAYVGWVLILLLGCVWDAEAQFTVQAAASDAVPGWQRMQSPDGAEPLWVSPTPASRPRT